MQVQVPWSPEHHRQQQMVRKQSQTLNSFHIFALLQHRATPHTTNATTLARTLTTRFRRSISLATHPTEPHPGARRCDEPILKLPLCLLSAACVFLQGIYSSHQGRLRRVPRAGTPRGPRCARRLPRRKGKAPRCGRKDQRASGALSDESHGATTHWGLASLLLKVRERTEHADRRRGGLRTQRIRSAHCPHTIHSLRPFELPKKASAVLRALCSSDE